MHNIKIRRVVEKDSVLLVDVNVTGSAARAWCAGFASASRIWNALFVGLSAGGIMLLVWCIGVLCGASFEACTNNARASGPPPLIDVSPLKQQSADRQDLGDGPMCSGEWRGPWPDELNALLTDEATVEERENVERAVAVCGGFRGPVHRVADPFAVLALLRLEAAIRAPTGLLLATWCIESAMRTEGRHGGRILGDYRDGVPLASGPFQLLEGVWSGTCGGTPDSPHNLIFAARCYWQNVLRVVPKVRQCGKNGLKAAEAGASNVRKYGLRCDSASAHWKVMKAMRLRSK